MTPTEAQRLSAQAMALWLGTPHRERLSEQAMASALRLAEETLSSRAGTTSHGAESLAKALLDASEIAETLARQLAEAKRENAFVAECLRWSSSIRTGVSSEAMIAFALDGKEPDPFEYPHDADDLRRCEGVYALAPASLRSRMLPLLTKYREALNTGDGPQTSPPESSTDGATTGVEGAG